MCLPAAPAAGAALAAAAPAAAGGLSAMQMLSIAGMAMQGLSTLSNMSAQRSQVNARNAVNEAELARQREMQQKADAVNAQTQTNFTREQQDANRAQEEAARNKMLTDAVAVPASMRAIPTSPGAPTVINSQIADSISKALGYGKTLAGANAKLGAYTGAQFGNNITLNRSAHDVGRIAGDSARSSDIAGMELDGANQAGNGARQLGDLFRVGGSGLSLYSMMGRPVGKVPEAVPGQYSLTNRQYGG